MFISLKIQTTGNYDTVEILARLGSVKNKEKNHKVKKNAHLN